MEKNEIVQKFFSRNRLLTPGALEFLMHGDISQYLDKEYNDFILTEKHLKADTIKILKNMSEKHIAETQEAVLNYYISKYEKMRDIITKRINKNFTSLNKMSTYRNEVFLIGIVKDVRENIIELEDPTATVSIKFDTPIDCELDDVIAVQAISTGKVLFGKKIIYPDIPLRSPTMGYGKACFISDLHLAQSPKEDIMKFFNWFDQQDIEMLHNLVWVVCSME